MRHPIGAPEGGGGAAPARDSAILAALTLLAALVQVPFMERGISFYDEGSILAIADGLRRGSVLYRDHITPTAPLTYELLGFLFRLWGPHLAVARGLQALVFVLTTLVVYGILRQFLSPRAAGAGALAVLPVKALGFPLYTIVNYSQLALLFCLAALLATLRWLATGRVAWLALAGLATGLTATTKQNLGAFIALAVGAAVVLEAVSRGRRSFHLILRNAAVSGLAAAFPVAATVAWYAYQGAFNALVARAVVGLTYLTEAYALPFPVPLGRVGTGEAVFTYFPSPLAQLAWRGEVDFERSRLLFLGILHAVQVLYVGPLLGIAGTALLAAAAWRRGALRQAWIGQGLIAGFGALAWTSMLYRPDWTHLLNVAPALLLPAVLVLSRVGAARRWGRFVVGAALVLWFGAGGVAAWTVCRAYDTPVDTPRGRLFARPDEADGTRRVLEYFAGTAGEPVLIMRADPLFYFLAARPMPTAFDLVMPGLLGPGDDERIRDDIRRVGHVLYNPKRILTVARPITEYAPLTAAALADEFRVVAALSPSAAVLRRDPAGPVEMPVVALRDRVAATRGEGARGPYAPDTWAFYRVLATSLHDRDDEACFVVEHEVGPGEVVAVTPMIFPNMWVQWPGDPDYSPDLVGVVFTVAVRPATGGAWETLASVTQPLGPPGERVRLPLDAFTGRQVELRFCARSAAAGPGPVYAVPGWAEPRIARLVGGAVSPPPPSGAAPAPRPAASGP